MGSFDKKVSQVIRLYLTGLSQHSIQLQTGYPADFIRDTIHEHMMRLNRKVKGSIKRARRGN
jgi:hypothetical protein